MPGIGIGLGLALAVGTGRGGVPSEWTPHLLFLNGEDGAIYDVQDLTTMYQDSLGTVPVTSENDPVGMILDISQGPRGGDLLTNGGFDGSADGWTDTGDAGYEFQYADGAVEIVRAAGGQSRLTQASVMITGKWYEITLDRVAASEDNPSLFVDNKNIGTSERAIFRAASTALVLRLAGNGSVTIDNISLKEVPGNHAVQETSGSRPTLKLTGERYWLDFDGDNDALVTTFQDLGSDVTIGRSVPTTGAVIQDKQSVSGTFSDTEDYHALVIVDRALTSGEQSRLGAWLNSRAGVAATATAMAWGAAVLTWGGNTLTWT